MNKKTKSVTVAASGIIALVLLSALSHADSRQYSDTLNINTSINEAASLALATVNGTLIEAELELDEGQAIWEFEIVDEANQVVCVEVDGATGEIVHTGHSDDVAPSLSNVISLEQAIELVNDIDNGALIEMELEEQADKLVWEVETLNQDNQELEYKIDAVSGEIIK